MEKRFSGTTTLSKQLQTGGGDEYELVKYMSKLPVYLERGETPQEKLLSVGVLDWGRLEEWQLSRHKRDSLKSGFPLASRTNAAVSDESSAGPSRVHTSTSAAQRKHRSSWERDPMLNSVEEIVKECREIRGTRKHHSSRQRDPMSNSVEEIVKERRVIRGKRKKKHKDSRCFSIPDEQFGLNSDAQGLDGYEKKELKAPEAVLNMEVKSKADGNRRRKGEKKLREKNRNDHDGELGRKQQDEYNLYHSTNKLAREKVNRCKRNSTKNVSVVHDVDVDYCTQHTCPLPCQADGCLAKSKSGSTDVDQNKASVEIPQCVSLSTKASTESFRRENIQDRASSLLTVKHRMVKPAERQDSHSHKAVSEKKRSTSPFQRLSFSMGKTNKTDSEGVVVPTFQRDSVTNSIKIGSQPMALSSGVDGSDCNKTCGKDTTTTSHLRRLLEPLMKTRTSHPGNSVEGTKGQSVQRVKLGITGCKTVNVNDSAHEKKLGPSMVRAVLRVTMRSNQPLFTFAVNKETDIIAATQKKMGSSEEGECTSVYTFFSIKNQKRNSVWLNQRGKGQTHGIISNVVAQMRVSSSLPSGSIREFVLFSVELDQENAEKTEMQLTNELAAIIVKMPRWFHKKASLNTLQDRNALNKGVEDHAKDRNLDQDISATVILQSGVHSMPQKGGPSSLIQRWRTGGSCDCGGWDMGCNLRILTNQHNSACKNTTASNSPPSSNRFELFFLGEQPEEHPFLSFKPIKEGIYSVAYNSSLSQLQAFSICMALAESRKMLEISLEHKSSCDEHNARPETVLVPDQDPKPNGNIRYQLPHSPVGRV